MTAVSFETLINVLNTGLDGCVLTAPVNPDDPDEPELFSIWRFDCGIAVTDRLNKQANISPREEWMFRVAHEIHHAHGGLSNRGKDHDLALNLYSLRGELAGVICDD
jgi:hypothetical protein